MPETGSERNGQSAEGGAESKYDTDLRAGENAAPGAPEESALGGVDPVGPLVESVARINATVHTRLLLGFLIGALLLIGMGTLSLVVITRMSNQVDELARLQEKVDRSRQMVYGITSQSHFRAMALLTLDDAFNDRIARAKSTFLENLDAVEKLSPDTLVSFSPTVREANDRFAASGVEALALYEAGEVDEALRVHLEEEHAISHEIESAARKLIGQSNDEMTITLASFRSDQRFMIAAVGSLLAIGLVVVIVVTAVLSRALRRRERNERNLQNALQQQVSDLQRSRQRIVTAEESLRKRIAELLHGSVQTKLLVAWHRLGQCQRMLKSDAAQAEALLADIREEIDRIREHEVREASHILHPSVINVGLVPAVRAMVAGFSDALEIALEVDPELTRLDTPIDNQVPDDVRLIAYRVLEEGLNNVYKHAEARSARIYLGIQPDGSLQIMLRDDGKGFDSSNVSPGLGLTSIADRVGALGGGWGITSAVGRGTTLWLGIPMTPATLQSPTARVGPLSRCWRNPER